MNLNELRDIVHAGNAKWWTDLETGAPLKRDEGELLMLVVTELSESVEGIRKNLQDDKLPNRKMEEVEMADAVIRLFDFAGGFKLNLFKVNPACVSYLSTIKNKARQILYITKAVVDVHFRVEEYDDEAISIAIAHIIHYCELHGLDLEGAIKEKLEYNKTRVDHTHEHRKSENGKKF